MRKDLTNAWAEWHETCELDKCSEENIHDLCVRSNKQFDNAVEKLKSYHSSGTLLQRPEECKSDRENENKYAMRYTFHLMESECLPSGPKEERQQFKDRIFAGAKNVGDVTGYFLRDFFRSLVKKKENKMILAEEINFETEEEGKEISFEEAFQQVVEKKIDLEKVDIPSYLSKSNYDSGEFLDQKLALNFAKEIWDSCNEVEQTALYAFINKVTMSAPELLKRVKLGKSSFSEMPKKIIDRVNKCLIEKIHDDDDRIDFLRKVLKGFEYCFKEWEENSEMGQWIVQNFSTIGNGEKIRYMG